MTTFEATRITMDWVMKRLENPMKMTEDEAKAHDLKMRQKKEFYGPEECEREDCPDRKDELCPFGEEFPKCPYGRDWDK